MLPLGSCLGHPYNLGHSLSCGLLRAPKSLPFSFVCARLPFFFMLGIFSSSWFFLLLDCCVTLDFHHPTTTFVALLRSYFPPLDHHYPPICYFVSLISSLFVSPCLPHHHVIVSILSPLPCGKSSSTRLCVNLHVLTPLC